ncbi:uncharacterized protein [Channa argus]|uniref:uncharacterized protein n=1 Tax=Channa argus TaxID=215402 RepID=UPI003521120D
MASAKFVFYLTSWALWKIVQTTSLKLSSSVDQESGFVSVNAGEKLTLHCSYNITITARLFWYKQTLGQKPRLISTFFVHHTSGTFYDEFKNNPRFTLETGNSKNHLKILEIQITDSAIYYCARSEPYKFEFLESITVSVKGTGLNIPVLVHDSVSEIIQPGGSVTLTCTVHTGTCDEEHSVYWFKESGESHPGIVYTNDDRNNQCERKPDTQTHTCVYNLQMKNLTRSHAGTYYCAVASCGKILLGNGTNVDIKYEVKSYTSVVYFLSGALTFTSILAVLLTFTLFKIIKRNNCQRSESQLRFSGPPTTNTEVNQDSDNLQYAALRVNLPNRSRRQESNTERECA